MSDWVLVPSLVSLRGEFNYISPDRDKGADGSIGDAAHTSASDHTPDEDSDILRDHDPDHKNEVHALDIDSSGPWPGTGTQKQRFHKLVMRVIAGEKAKWKDDNDMCRLNYVIWDGQIYDKDADFQPVGYHGVDPHTNHAHFSNRYETRAENDTRPWGVKEEDDVTPEEVLAVLNSEAGQAAMAKAAGKGVHNQKLGASDVTIGQAVQGTNLAMPGITVALADLKVAILGAIAAIPVNAAGSVNMDDLAEAIVDGLGELKFVPTVGQ